MSTHLSPASLRPRSATLDDLPALKECEQGIIAAERPYDHTLKPDPISYYDLGERMFVHPDHRGKGLNRILTDYLLDWARMRDLTEIRLTVYSGNDPAIRAYEKAGFNPYITEMRLNLDE